MAYISPQTFPQPITGTDSTLVIEVPNSPDIPAIQRLLAESDPTALSLTECDPTWLLQTTLSPDTLCLIATLQGAKSKAVIGICTLLQEMPPSIQTLYLGLLVAPTYRGHGIGKRLLQTALDWASTHPTLEEITLEVLKDNNPAIQLYTHCDFQLVNPAHIIPSDATKLTMKKTLKGSGEVSPPFNSTRPNPEFNNFLMPIKKFR